MFLYPLLFVAFSRCSCLWSVPFLVIDLRKFGFLGVFWSWILFRLRAFDFRKLLNLFWFFALTGTLTGDEIVQDYLNCIASIENNYTVHITGCSIETTAERVKVQVSPGKRGQMGIPGRNRIFLIGIWRWLKTSQLFYVFSQDQLTFISCIRIFMLIK